MSSELAVHLTASKAESIHAQDFATYLDATDPLKDLRQEFSIPTSTCEKSNSDRSQDVYFCGNSLGLLPKATVEAVDKELKAWGRLGVVAHFDRSSDKREPWVTIDRPVVPLMAEVVGAKQDEVAVMGTLTGNLHALFSAFYNPTKERFKIIYEQKAFPSDRYALGSIARLHGFKEEEVLVPLAPRPGEYTLRTQDIVEAIRVNGTCTAIVWISGIQFYTGQFFDIPQITSAGHAQGCLVGWDLAHAVGNVPLQLHDWKVDFACWCSYKYLNAGPGGIAGLFVHEIYGDDNRPRQAGWWGNNLQTRFKMLDQFDPIPGAQGFRVSNPSVLDTVCLHESLKIFKKSGGIKNLRKKSCLLTDYLYTLLESSQFNVPVENEDSCTPQFTIITPPNSNQRGAQLSLLFRPPGTMKKVFSRLFDMGIVGDEREPNVIRLAPTPLYNTFSQVLYVFESLQSILESLQNQS